MQQGLPLTPEGLRSKTHPVTAEVHMLALHAASPMVGQKTAHPATKSARVAGDSILISAGCDDGCDGGANDARGEQGRAGSAGEPHTAVTEHCHSVPDQASPRASPICQGFTHFANDV